MNWIEKVLKSGVSADNSVSENRSITLSNIICVILFLSVLLLGIIRFFVHGGTLVFFARQYFLGGILFVLPIILNYCKLTKFGRVFLCYVPVFFLWFAFYNLSESDEQVTISLVEGLRIYLLGLSCLPFLLIEPDRIDLLIVGIIPALFSLLCFHLLTDFVYPNANLVDNDYQFNFVRSLISYLIICGGCLSLKIFNFKSEQRNEKLIAELENKNRIIQNQAESSVNKLNKELRVNLDSLSRSENLLKRSQEIAKVGSWEYDVATKNITWSDEMYNIFGISKNADLTNPRINEALFGESAELLDDAFYKVLAKGTPYDFTFKVKTPIGYSKWIRVCGFPMMTGETVSGVSGIVHDITFFKESEERMRNSETRYKSLFEQGSDAILIHNFNGDILNVNQQMTSIFGYSKDELVQMKLSDLMDKQELESKPIHYTELANGEHVFSERTMIRKDRSAVDIEANVKRFNETEIMAIVRDITERKEVEREKERARYQLRERIKELTTLYKVSQILSEEYESLGEVMDRIVQVLPAGWQYPEICEARILLNDEEYKTGGFKEVSPKIKVPIKLYHQEVGFLEVIYVSYDKPDDEPFLVEERNLLETLADMLEIFLTRKQEEDERQKFEANLMSTINNTEIFIWSVDRDLRLINFNEPFFKYIKKRYGTEIKVGSRVLEGAPTDDNVSIELKWDERYKRVLEGEALSLEESRKGIDLQYSLSPIVKNGEVIGISSFAEDITARKQRDRDLAEATKKIADLQLMALRSVMNPHFIFNALNSIQYFITKNDRLNAINYLSTFSKLIRGILTNSVDRAIKLSEEIELLKHYVSLEQLRFENKFSFSLTVDSKIDADGIEIPSLLIQPYVENAILHGLYNKDEAGNLEIRIIESNDDFILIEVEDDGVGREAAKAFRAKNFPQHRSMGIFVTEERLRLINQQSTNVSVEIIDKMNGSLGAGTLVKVQIKI